MQQLSPFPPCPQCCDAGRSCAGCCLSGKTSPREDDLCGREAPAGRRESKLANTARGQAKLWYDNAVTVATGAGKGRCRSCKVAPSRCGCGRAPRTLGSSGRMEPPLGKSCLCKPAQGYRSNGGRGLDAGVKPSTMVTAGGTRRTYSSRHEGDGEKTFAFHHFSSEMS